MCKEWYGGKAADRIQQTQMCCVMPCIRMNVTFSGQVQGVSFRFHTQKFALENGITGWVRNTEEGTVEAVFEGSEEAVRKVMELCTRHIPLAKVSSSESVGSECTGEFSSFSIR